MNRPARLDPAVDPIDVIAIALARALARQHHAESTARRIEDPADASLLPARRRA